MLNPDGTEAALVNIRRFVNMAEAMGVDSIELLATVPGEYRAPASSTYLYYTDEHKTWVDGVKVTIEP